MYMVNVCLPEQRSLCFSNVCVLVLKTVRGWGGGVGSPPREAAPKSQQVLGGWKPPARVSSLALLSQLAGGASARTARSGCFPVFANAPVWFPVRIRIIISKKDTFELVRIIIYKVLSLIIPLSLSCPPWNLHNNQTSKPEPFTGRKVFPLHYFNKINYNDQFNLNLPCRFFFLQID